MDNSLSAGKDFAKIAGENVLTKSAEATGDLIGNEIADRITKSLEIKIKKKMIYYSNYYNIKWNTITLITCYVLKN